MLVNLVGTRAVRGEHDALLRWYADHVHQLMAFDDLRGAALHRRCGERGDAPQYVCLYDFTDRDAFAAYERSDVHADAARDRLAGWGRDGIEITLRTQFERLYSSGHSATPGERCTLQVVRAPTSQERALAAQAVQRASPSHTLLRAVAAAAPQPPVKDWLLIEQGCDTAPPLEGFDVAWHAGYEHMRSWWR